MNKKMREHMYERFGSAIKYEKNPDFPHSLNIELNSTCNHKCVFCPFHGKYAKNTPLQKHMDIEDVKRILVSARELGIGRKELGFYMSGEPFLYEKLPEAIEFAKSLGYGYIFLTTNGSQSDEDKLKKALDAGLDSIRFSINASNREDYKMIHGVDDFDKVVKNIKWMHNYISNNKYDVATSISCVITKKTKGIQNEVRCLFQEYVDDIIFFPVRLNRLIEDAAMEEEWGIVDEQNVEKVPEYVCSMLFNTMYINANLEVVPCCEAYDTNCVFYDLKKDFNLEKAWKSSAYNYHRGIFLDNFSDEGTICNKCTLRMGGIEKIVME